MRRILSIIKSSLRTIGLIVLAIFLFLYISAHYNLSGYIAKKSLTEDFAEYLGTEVELGSASVDIFNQVVLENLLIKDLNNDTLLYTRRALVSFDLLPLLYKDLVIHTIQFVDFNIKANRYDNENGFNYQFIVDAFAPKDKNNQRQLLKAVNINSIILRNGKISYDDLFFNNSGEPVHLNFTNVSSNIKIQSLVDSGVNIYLKRLNLNEDSGLEINKLATVITIDSYNNHYSFDDIVYSGNYKIDSYKFQTEFKGAVDLKNENKSCLVDKLSISEGKSLKIDTEFRASKKDTLAIDFDLHDFDLKANSQVVTYFLKKFNYNNNTINKYIAHLKTINLDLSAKGNTDNYLFKGKLFSDGFLSSNVDFEGNYDNHNYKCIVDGSASNLEFNQHTYKFIDIEGTITNNSFEGLLSIDDPLCNLYSNGLYKFEKNKIVVNSQIELDVLYPYDLHFTDIDNFKNVGISFSANSNLEIVHSRPVGNLNAESIAIFKNGKIVDLGDLTLNALKTESKYDALISSQLLNGEFYELTNQTLSNGRVNFSSELADILNLPVSLGKEASFDIELDSLKNITSSEVVIKEAKYKDNTVNLNVVSQRGIGDVLYHSVELEGLNKDHRLITRFNASTQNTPISFEVEPCKVRLDKSTILCNGIKAHQVDDDSFELEKFNLHYNKQYIDANGIVSVSNNSNLHVNLRNLDISPFLKIIDNKYVDFGGYASGDIYVRNDSTLFVETNNLYLKEFNYLNSLLGNTKLNAKYEISNKLLSFDAEVESPEVTYSNLEGTFQIADHSLLDLSVNADHMRTEFLSFWLGGFLEKFGGTYTGDARLSGWVKELHLEGKGLADVKFTNDLSGSVFNLQDTIVFTHNSHTGSGNINLRNAKLLDRFGHVSQVNASINHKYLQDYVYDIRIDFPNDNAGFLVFDKPSHYNNELYWGQLYANGQCTLRGGYGRHRIDLNCKTVGRSQFNLSPGEESYSDNGYNFLVYRDKKQYEESENLEFGETRPWTIEETKDDSPLYIEFDVQAQATENCQVYVQMDPLAEDRLICRGNGDISLHYDPRHDITIGGEYTMTSGNYLITMRGDLINKEFRIQNGSRVLFPGNFSNAELDINAIYSIPSVNLRDLDESFATMASMNRTTLPVDCKLNVSGQISAPQITFDLDVKNTSDDVQALVHNLIGTQEMLNREVFYLLLFSKFYTPEYASNTQNNTGSQLSSFASASLTSQLNNLLGHVSDNLSLGTNFRSDRGDFSDMEMDLTMSTRLFSDRLILNGNLGYRDPANRVGLRNNTNSFIGDFDAEFLMNTTGTLRAKAYSHYNERDYSINNALTTQGVGFVIRKDFKTVKELLFWRNRIKK